MMEAKEDKNATKDNKISIFKQFLIENSHIDIELINNSTEEYLPHLLNVHLNPAPKHWVYNTFFDLSFSKRLMSEEAYMWEDKISKIKENLDEYERNKQCKRKVEYIQPLKILDYHKVVFDDETYENILATVFKFNEFLSILFSFFTRVSLDNPFDKDFNNIKTFIRFVDKDDLSFKIKVDLSTFLLWSGIVTAKNVELLSNKDLMKFSKAYGWEESEKGREEKEVRNILKERMGKDVGSIITGMIIDRDELSQFIFEKQWSGVNQITFGDGMMGAEEQHWFYTPIVKEMIEGLQEE